MRKKPLSVIQTGPPWARNHCSDCQFFVPITILPSEKRPFGMYAGFGDLWAKEGECRAHSIAKEWPIRGIDEWCGEWKEKDWEFPK